jgi:hypothetical protein
MGEKIAEAKGRYSVKKKVSDAAGKLKGPRRRI